MEKLVAWQFSETGAGTQIKEKVDLNLVKRSFFEKYNR